MTENAAEGAELYQFPVSNRAPAGFRELPHNIEAEQGLLGAILVNNEAYRLVADFLQPDHFYEPVHGRIYGAVQSLAASGSVADHVTLATAFDEDEALRELDGARYLANLARAAVSILDARDYGRHVFELAMKRALIAICEEGVNLGYEPGLSIDWLQSVGQTKAKLDRLEAGAATSASWMSLGDVVEQLAKQVEAPPRHVKTGLHALDDDLSGGLLGGRVYGVEASAKSFKTGFLATVCRNLIFADVPHLFVMADRTIHEAIARIVAFELGTNSKDFERGGNRAEADLIRQLKLPDCAMLAQESSLTIARLKALATRAVDLGAKGIILDYWQRVDALEGPRDSKPAAHARVADWMKSFAIDRDVWFLVASQANRDEQTLWSAELERACVWLGKLKRVDRKRLGWNEQCVWIEVALRTHGAGKSIGSEEFPAWVIDERGPLLTTWLP